jgi:hypothetical protein
LPGWKSAFRRWSGDELGRRCPLGSYLSTGQCLTVETVEILQDCPGFFFVVECGVDRGVNCDGYVVWEKIK